MEGLTFKQKSGIMGENKMPILSLEDVKNLNKILVAKDETIKLLREEIGLLKKVIELKNEIIRLKDARLKLAESTINRSK